MDRQFGGVGARSTKDGLDITPPLIFSGGSVAHTVEALEMEYPVRFRSYRLRQDSGGPGLWRGGLRWAWTVARRARDTTGRPDSRGWPAGGLPCFGWASDSTATRDEGCRPASTTLGRTGGAATSKTPCSTGGTQGWPRPGRRLGGCSKRGRLTRRASSS
ncbi:MAG: hydantoinase B/oxoprolinase family protein [Chloroflexi bacterium]|nr:hydantoinase B/oxoprolinase family protein [Chloroflexota bacterium]